MQLYLSSYHLGSRAAEFAALVGGKKRIGVIRNALDFSTDTKRLLAGREREFNDLISLGLTPEDIDLRDYFGNPGVLTEDLKQLDGLWVTGGNCFILRRAFRQSGLEDAINRLMDHDRFVYAGYSAGICVLCPTLKGIHLADKPDLVPANYSNEVIWEGLNILPYCIAPHYKSDHAESEMIDDSVAYFIENKIPFVVLRDGEDIITSTAVK